MASKRGRRRFDPEDEGRRSAPRGGKKGARKDAAPHYEIDLHGCTAASAERRVAAGLARCRASGRSPVLIITGKGYGSMGGNGILGPSMERWLKGPAGQAAGVASIRAVRSGGALEVTLRRGSDAD